METIFEIIETKIAGLIDTLYYSMRKNTALVGTGVALSKAVTVMQILIHK